MSAIIQEGLGQRSKGGIKAWICTGCNHVMSFLTHNSECPNCKSSNIQPIKSPELLHEETEALKDKERFHYWQPGAFNPQSWESQIGKPMTPEQVLTVIKKWIPGAKIIPQFNPFLRKMLSAFYIPYTWKPEEVAIVSKTESRGNLKFVCCGELKMMPEWDVLPLDDEKRPLPPIRGWRSVLGIFYRSGYIPFVPDDGTRLGWWQIRESPIRRENA